MKIKTLLFLTVSLLMTSTLIAQEDIIVIEGGTNNPGSLEAAINADTTDAGERVNPNRIYELKADQFYLQQGPISIENPGGTLTIRGQEGGSKPVIIKQVENEVQIGQNFINSNLKLENIQYHSMETDGSISWNQFNISGNNRRLTIDNCFFENTHGQIFNMNSVLEGAVIDIRNSYFRDLFKGNEWWQARIIEAKVPYDTLIFVNNTVTGAGLMILNQESLIEYAVINHNTIINNHKYPFLNQYYKEVYFTNNLFVNANMAGEDHENVATGGQDPDGLLHGITGIDTISNSIQIQSKFLDENSNLTDEVDGIEDLIYYAADNVITYSATLDPYYNGDLNDVYNDAPASYLTWGGVEGPFKVDNVPAIWANSRTQQLVADHDNIKDENNHIYTMMAEDLGLGTDPLPQAAADYFAVWNQAQWGVPGAVKPTDFTVYLFGDYDPLTIPGVETESTPSGTGGITKISDLLEDFSYTADLTSKSDGLRIGALHWDDEEFDAEASLTKVKAAYNGETSGIENLNTEPELNLKNYPNPFTETTTISFNLATKSHVKLTVFDISGKLVKTLLNENRMAGTHEIIFEPENMFSGIYFCELSTDKGNAVQRMTLHK